MAVRPIDPTGPKIGALLPDFTVETITGRTIHRREFKGRKHLVVCFARIGAGADLQELVRTIAAAYPAWQAERAECLFVVNGPGEGAVALTSVPIVGDTDGQLRARFGVGDDAAIFIADRYGEIAFCATAADVTATQGLPLDEVLPTLELLEMRCSL